MNLDGLLPWQPAAAEKLVAALDTYGGALDASDMGTGKSYQAAAVLRHYDRPSLVVCPAVAQAAWRGVRDAMGTKFSILNYEALRTGRSPFGEWEHPRKPAEKFFVCDSCQQKFKSVAEIKARRCPHHGLGIHCISVKSKPHDYGKFVWHSGIGQLVFDEVHRASALDSLQADMLIAAKRQRIPTLGMSATVAESPLDLRALGYLLGLHGLVGDKGFFPWAFARGVRKHPMGGFHFAAGEARSKEIMADIHAEVFSNRGARVRIADLGSAFPEVQITAELYDAPDAERIAELYAEMDDAIVALNGERGLDKCPELPVTVLLRASQEIELLTVPVFEELARDANAQGLHCAIFVNYRRTVEELCKRLKTQCRIDGSQIGEAGAKRRAKCIEDFQADREPNIVSSIPAGGITVSLQDVRGQFPRLGLVSPCYDAKQFRQVMGRLRRATGKSTAYYRVVLIDKTPQVKMHKALSKKLNNIDSLNDGDLAAASNLPLTRHSLTDIFNTEHL